MLDKRVTVMKPTGCQIGEYGRKRDGWEEVVTVWASVDWTRGVKAMREGALDAYDVVMVRMRWHREVNRSCRLVIDGRTYVIQSFNDDRRRNTIQLTAQETIV